MTQHSHRSLSRVSAWSSSSLCAVMMLAACHKPMLWLGTSLDTSLTGVAPDAGASEQAAGLAPAPEAQVSATQPEPTAGELQPSTGGEPSAPAQPPATHTQAVAGMTGATSSFGGAGIAAAADSGGVKDAEDSDAGAGDALEARPTRLPTAQRACPKLNAPGTYNFGGASRSLAVRIYIAPDARNKPAPGGPLILYWHGFGNAASEVETGLGTLAIDDVVARGGVVAAFNSRWCASCGLPEDVAWYKEDDAVSDQVIACAIEQARIDTRHIHAIGFSAGALHSLHLALARSNFIASVVSYSGGSADLMPADAQDASNRVPTLLSYGSAELDAVGLNFNMTSLQWYETYHALGWYLLMCGHGGGHVIPSDLATHAYRFLLDHPYKATPEAYATRIPAEFPSYCRDRP